MREIKFRVWDGKYMHFGGFLDGGFRGSPSDTASSPVHMIHQQYTGLKDKKGREIYEGDIVKVENRFLATIVYNDGAYRAWPFGFASAGAVPAPIGSIHGFDSSVHEIEIFGNIYENWELLK